MRELHLGALCFGIYKWAQSDSNDKSANSVAVSEVDLLSVYSEFCFQFEFLFNFDFQMHKTHLKSFFRDFVYRRLQVDLLSL